jgi:hypothetical protein
MTEAEPHSVVCDCCDLDFPVWMASDEPGADDHSRGWCCAACYDHQRDELAMARDHEDELRVRHDRALVDLDAETYRADDYREKMLAAFRSRDHVLKQFERLARYHRATDYGCICGKRNCETLAVVDADWINDRIAAMYRHG